MLRTHSPQAVCANVVLAIAVAVAVFGAPIVPAVVGGVGAGIFLAMCFRLRRNASGRE